MSFHVIRSNISGEKPATRGLLGLITVGFGAMVDTFKGFWCFQLDMFCFSTGGFPPLLSFLLRSLLFLGSHLAPMRSSVGSEMLNRPEEVKVNLPLHREQMDSSTQGYFPKLVSRVASTHSSTISFHTPISDFAFWLSFDACFRRTLTDFPISVALSVSTDIDVS